MLVFFEQVFSHMIVNHQYKFIFLKTRKTAGTSIEIALSRFCGPNDVVTPITPGDEVKRQELGYRGPQNYHIPLYRYRLSDWRALMRERKSKKFFNHAPAWYVRQYLGKKIWNGYFKFCFERNPFDKAISAYYWYRRPRNGEEDFDGYLRLPSERERLTNWGIYTLNDEIVVDYVGRYERLNEDLGFVIQQIGLPGQVALPLAKAGIRPDRSHYSQKLSAYARGHIESICAREIDAFSYEWVDSAQS
jgi:hypothetical protein